MNKLSHEQLRLIAQHVRKTSPHQALQAELLDHIASLIEQRMDQGQTYPAAFDQVMQQANSQALAQLKQLYLREFSPRISPVTSANSRFRVRSKRRPATKPFQYVLFSSVFMFLVLMGFLLVVSQPMAIPVGAFHTAWGAGLVAFMSVFAVRWVLARRSRKSRPFLTV